MMRLVVAAALVALSGVIRADDALNGRVLGAVDGVAARSRGLGTTARSMDDDETYNLPTELEDWGDGPGDEDIVLVQGDSWTMCTPTEYPWKIYDDIAIDISGLDKTSSIMIWYHVTLNGTLTFVPEDITIWDIDQVSSVNLMVPEPDGGWQIGENTVAFSVGPGALSEINTIIDVVSGFKVDGGGVTAVEIHQLVIGHNRLSASTPSTTVDSTAATPMTPAPSMEAPAVAPAPTTPDLAAATETLGTNATPDTPVAAAGCSGDDDLARADDGSMDNDGSGGGLARMDHGGGRSRGDLAPTDNGSTDNGGGDGSMDNGGGDGFMDNGGGDGSMDNGGGDGSTGYGGGDGFVDNDADDGSTDDDEMYYPPTEREGSADDEDEDASTPSTQPPMGASTASPVAPEMPAPAPAAPAPVTAEPASPPATSGGSAPDDWVTILDLHNQARCIHNADPLTWDTAVAASAEAYAAVLSGNCDKLEHSDSEYRDGYGENLYWCGPTPGCYSADNAMYGLYDEEIEFDSVDDYGGHATQILWQSTTTVGCAVSSCSSGEMSGDFLVCQYNPPGNYVGQTATYVDLPNSGASC